ncbi:MAG: gliding motility-associated C-terminal domain-containing protein [Flammeovirgaceae bacterium]|nr:MAG: gliding motility-associated C-terminal domain-containing protein [Flammeovirgaceae bacterium]
MKSLLIAFFCCVILNPVAAQKQAAIWYFGENAGLDFRQGSPRLLPNGALKTEEGTATISDAQGNLLLYTDGVTVYNQFHEVMTNGTNLWGHFSTTQTLVVQRPNDNSIYYIFTASPSFDTWFGPGSDSVGFHYSVVNKALRGGAGEVVQKNILLHRNTTEKMAAVFHTNGTDIWVLTHEWNSNRFLAYLITETGINTSPVASIKGSILQKKNGTNANAAGQLKILPDGTKVVNATPDFPAGGIIELFEFDSSSGMVTNLIDRINLGLQVLTHYGTEFSPDSRFVYFTVSYTFCGVNDPDQPSTVWQYSFENKTLKQVGHYIGKLGAMQLGPDGKIYVASCNDIAGESGSIAVINYPNRHGNSCNFQSKAISTTGRSRSGLPNFIASYFRFEDPVIDMPNIFTPNGDVYNPVFKPIVFDHMVDADLTIFNRWGQQVYYTREVKSGWDGDNASEGVYYWLLRYEGKNGKKGTAKGWVHLLR